MRRRWSCAQEPRAEVDQHDDPRRRPLPAAPRAAGAWAFATRSRRAGARRPRDGEPRRARYVAAIANCACALGALGVPISELFPMNDETPAITPGLRETSTTAEWGRHDEL